jgi:hypothetical protein
MGREREIWAKRREGAWWRRGRQDDAQHGVGKACGHEGFARTNSRKLVHDLEDFVVETTDGEDD